MGGPWHLTRDGSGPERLSALRRIRAQTSRQVTGHAGPPHPSEIVRSELAEAWLRTKRHLGLAPIVCVFRQPHDLEGFGLLDALNLSQGGRHELEEFFA